MIKRGSSHSSSFEVKKLGKFGWPEEIVKKTLQHPEDRRFILKLEKVGINFGDTVVLKEISLAIKEGEIFGIVGLAGSGKSTLLNALVGLLKPTRGKVLLRLRETESEVDVNKKRSLANSLIGFSTQTPSFYPELTVEENIEYFISLYGFGIDKFEEIKENVFNLVPLKNLSGVKAKNLSKGQQKKLDLACAIVHSPDILVVDEPIADFDPVFCRELWGLIRRVNNAGTTVVLASHRLEELENICSRIGILHNGSIVRIVETSALSKEPYEVILSIPHPRHFIRKISGDAIFGNDSVSIKTSNPMQTASSLINQVKKSGGENCLLSFSIKRLSLKELFDEVVR